VKNLISDFKSLPDNNDFQIKKPDAISGFYFTANNQPIHKSANWL